jgi:hypothetical protein
MKLSANQAHKRAKISKKTLLKHLDDGTLSGTRNTRGHWEIDLSELRRVFPEQGQEQDSPQVGNTSETTENRVLQAQLEANAVLLARVEQELEDTRAQRDKWQAQAERLLLTQQAPAAPEAHRTPSRGLFGFRWGRGAA